MSASALGEAGAGRRELEEWNDTIQEAERSLGHHDLSGTCKKLDPMMRSISKTIRVSLDPKGDASSVSSTYLQNGKPGNGLSQKGVTAVGFALRRSLELYKGVVSLTTLDAQHRPSLRRMGSDSASGSDTSQSEDVADWLSDRLSSLGHCWRVIAHPLQLSMDHDLLSIEPAKASVSALTTTLDFLLFAADSSKGNTDVTSPIESFQQDLIDVTNSIMKYTRKGRWGGVTPNRADAPVVLEVPPTGAQGPTTCFADPTIPAAAKPDDLTVLMSGLAGALGKMRRVAAGLLSGSGSHSVVFKAWAGGAQYDQSVQTNRGKERLMVGAFALDNSGGNALEGIGVDMSASTFQSLSTLDQTGLTSPVGESGTASDCTGSSVLSFAHSPLNVHASVWTTGVTTAETCGGFSVPLTSIRLTRCNHDVPVLLTAKEISLTLRALPTAVTANVPSSLETQSLECGYWDERNGEWGTEGCDLTHGGSECVCNRFADFSLVYVTEKPAPSAAILGPFHPPGGHGPHAPQPSAPITPHPMHRPTLITTPAPAIFHPTTTPAAFHPHHREQPPQPTQNTHTETSVSTPTSAFDPQHTHWHHRQYRHPHRYVVYWSNRTARFEDHAALSLHPIARSMGLHVNHHWLLAFLVTNCIFICVGLVFMGACVYDCYAKPSQTTSQRAPLRKNFRSVLYAPILRHTGKKDMALRFAAEQSQEDREREGYDRVTMASMDPNAAHPGVSQPKPETKTTEPQPEKKGATDKDVGSRTLRPIEPPTATALSHIPSATPIGKGADTPLPDLLDGPPAEEETAPESKPRTSWFFFGRSSSPTAAASSPSPQADAAETGRDSDSLRDIPLDIELPPQTKKGGPKVLAVGKHEAPVPEVIPPATKEEMPNCKYDEHGPTALRAVRVGGFKLSDTARKKDRHQVVTVNQNDWGKGVSTATTNDDFFASRLGVSVMQHPQKGARDKDSDCASSDVFDSEVQEQHQKVQVKVLEILREKRDETEREKKERGKVDDDDIESIDLEAGDGDADRKREGAHGGEELEGETPVQPPSGWQMLVVSFKCSQPILSVFCYPNFLPSAAWRATGFVAYNLTLSAFLLIFANFLTDHFIPASSGLSNEAAEGTHRLIGCIIAGVLASIVASIIRRLATKSQLSQRASKGPTYNLSGLPTVAESPSFWDGDDPRLKIEPTILGVCVSIVLGIALAWTYFSLLFNTFRLETEKSTKAARYYLYTLVLAIVWTQIILPPLHAISEAAWERWRSRRGVGRRILLDRVRA
uniref:Uncharacterized protein n=1 Tax=Chromera velia CCMP2878 TaxID=1169474 RepID=A0A0G4H0N7_9ALVE|eukprot:Cvel_24224.t1-p1 / transcript=Cvel_24224.t1 / gene=Cvel_24224 / organism=Chromera_velia_CCMP2878 / gene_product=hypothetical protein / transcript_product=hypothetical protein / location=Cvel_scaffold2590:13328-18111(-) / protein_length=1268 / sequence_SO=supercontig / SO=protein_coding / is_pseudo=false